MSKKVLVIEDNDDIRTLLLNTLDLFGFDVQTVENGRDAVPAASTFLPDVIVCDIMLPYLNGYEVYKRLAQLGIVPRTPFIFLTALDTTDDIRRGMVLGADDYIAKPFAPKDLVEAIEAVLKRRELLQQTYTQQQMLFDVFISYSHVDMDLMRMFRQYLLNAGLKVWTDEFIDAGRDWAEMIAEAIKNSSCLVCLLTEDAAQSKWVGRELGFAELNETQIFPVLLGNNEQRSVPIRLVNHQFIDGREDHERCIQELIEELHLYLGYVDEEEEAESE